MTHALPTSPSGCPSTVEPIQGEPTRFYVASRSGAEPWLVDVEDYNGNGACGCPHFQNRILFKLENILEQEPGDILQCHHIRAAQAFYKAQLEAAR